MTDYPLVQLDCVVRPFDEDHVMMHWTMGGRNERMNEWRGEEWGGRGEGEERKEK